MEIETNSISQINLIFFDYFLGEMFLRKIFSYALAAVFGTAVIALLVSQLGLTVPAVRTTLTNVSDYEDAMGQTEDNSQLGEITLSLHGVNANADIKVLQNGDAIAFFLQDTINVTVRNNSLIEIDGTKVKDNFSVTIASQSQNISFSDEIREITVDKNIAILTRVFVK